MTAALLQVQNLSIGFQNENEALTAITDDVSFDVHPGETLGLVGESGCGKTVTTLAILRLLPQPQAKILSGSIFFEGQDLLQAPATHMQQIRGKGISMIFQEPFAAMNPLFSIEQQLLEGFQYHPYEGNQTPQKHIQTLLEQVGIPDPPRVLKSYPHELSGGMLQRVVIAMALLHRPKLIIADEPTTALDVTVQAQIMELLASLQKDYGTAIILITHNLGLVAQYADRVAVMYAGRLVETGKVATFLEQPQHPYSQGLLRSLPQITTSGAQKGLEPIPGNVPRPENFATGCRFQDRCPHAMDQCTQKPPLQAVNENQSVACFLRASAD